MSVSKTKEYHRQKSKDHYTKTRLTRLRVYAERRKSVKEFYDAIKSRGCCFCPEKEPVAIDFHHLSGKDYGIAQMSNMNIAAVQKEIEKCVCICSNCHRKLHANLITLPENVQTVKFPTLG